MAEPEGLKWGIERRIAFLDACLHWLGQVNRSDLTAFFGISSPQATSDLARYQNLAPRNLTYDIRRKAYLRGEGFRPVIGTPTATEILMSLAEGSRRDDRPREPWAEGLKVERLMPDLSRAIDEEVFTSLIGAARGGHSVSIRYQSFSGAASDRLIYPYAFVSDGIRWHVRAHCRKNDDFRDFVVSRVSDCTFDGSYVVDPEADWDWKTQVTMRLGPNPRLDPEKRHAVQREYDMKRGVAVLETRACHVFYIAQRLYLDLDPPPRNPAQQQLVWLNRKDCERRIDLARRKSQSELQAAKRADGQPSRDETAEDAALA